MARASGARQLPPEAAAEPAESYQMRQENELQVLESIYGQDFQDLRQSQAWKVASGTAAAGPCEGSPERGGGAAAWSLLCRNAPCAGEAEPHVPVPLPLGWAGAAGGRADPCPLRARPVALAVVAAGLCGALSQGPIPCVPDRALLPSCCLPLSLRRR